MNGLQRIGTSDVYIIPTQEYVGNDKHHSGSWGRIRLPLPPSANDWLRPAMRYVTRRGYGGLSSRAQPFLLLTNEAKAYYAQAPALRIAWSRLRRTAIDKYTRFRFYFFLKNPRYDSHNGLKIVCDLIEKSGLVTNDNVILPEVMEPVLAKDDPRLLIEFPL